MRESVRNTRWACTCGRFVRTSLVGPDGYVCTRCGRRPGAAREVVVGHTVTMVDVLVAIPGRGRVPITDGQEELDGLDAREVVVGSPCRPLHCPTCGAFSAESWQTDDPNDVPEDGYQEWGGLCSVHGRWSDST